LRAAKYILDQMIVTPSEIPHSELYGLILNSVAPRPIAWVSTVSASGQANLAPFSFFNAVCVDPPLLAFAAGLRKPKADTGYGEAKDTLRNVRETKEFVVNIVTYELAEAMNVTSGEYDASVNEFELARVTPAASKIVRAPRVAESPVSFDCAHQQQPGHRPNCFHSHGRCVY
jgi:flavin reductase (DIM6/NTAB) family NADH-FMN oxidoreductase RutF